MLIIEHSAPSVCPGCLRIVVPCITEIKDITIVCLPGSNREIPVPAPPSGTEVVEAQPVAAQEDKQPESESLTGDEANPVVM